MNQPKNIEIEYELTFLLSYLPPELKAVRPVQMEDIYVPDNIEHPHLRIRRKGDTYEITKKVPIKGQDSSVQSEQTIPLDSQEFKALAKSSVKTISKDRYKLTINGSVVEIDVFQGALKGLVLADFEFKNKEDKEKFSMPDYCLADVTQAKFLAGGMLAGKSYKDIENELEKLSYKPIL